jgi:hypothetical protein
MSQNLTPISNSAGVVGLTPQLNTTIDNQRRIKIFSPQYKEAKGLFVQPTQWNPVGRPIYGRLPAASEQYQLNFFEDGGRGYVFIPRGGDLFGPGSMYVDQSENLDVLLIENGAIVWEEGTTPVYKTFLDLREVGVEDGRYLICYQLIYDDEPQPLPFQVEDYCLAGLDFSVIDSASKSFQRSEDKADPWPFPGINMFAYAEQELEWKNYIDLVNRSPGAQAGIKPGFPDYEQPLLSWVAWESVLPWKLDTIKVRTTLTANVPPCGLYIASEDPDEGWELVQQNPALLDVEGYYWEFQTDMAPQFKWKLDWGATTRVNASKLTVSGQLYIPSKPSVPVPRAQLAIYPTNLIPKDESLCRLAIISVDNFMVATKPSGELYKEDIREIVNRDYDPIANWLTQYWDDQLITLWAQVKAFTPGFMAPPTLLRTSYEGLELYGIDVNSDPLPYPRPPSVLPPARLVGASVLLNPPLPENTSLTGATVSFFTQPGNPAITGITLEVVNP